MRERRATRDTATRSPHLSETILAYDRAAEELAARYAGLPTERLLTRFVRLLPRPDPRVLDAGCGTGRDLAKLHRMGVTVWGVDASSRMLEMARINAPSACLVEGDIRDLPFSDLEFDGIWSMASLVHLDQDDFRKAWAEFYRVLVPGGVAFASIAFGDGSEWRGHDKMRRWFQYFESEEVREAVASAGFSIIDLSVEAGVVSGKWINIIVRRPPNG